MSWLLDRLRERVASLKAAGLPVPAKPPVRKRTWLFPWALQKRYERKIGEVMRRFFATIDWSKYPDWLKSYHGDAESFSAGWSRTLASLRAAQKDLFDGDEAENLYGGIFTLSNDVNDFNADQWRAFLQGMLGTEFFPLDYPGIQETLTAWRDRNFELIRSLTDAYIQKVNDLVTDGVRNGTRWEDLAPQIKALEQRLSVTRARLIARDQVSKLNGELARRRQMDAGVEEYTWSTSGDERVRGNPLGPYAKAIPSHYLMDGKVCRWDNPSVYKLNGEWVPRTSKMSPAHPSQEIQCRCVGLPRMEELWQEAKATA